MKMRSLNNCSGLSGFAGKLCILGALFLFQCHLVCAQLRLVPIEEGNQVYSGSRVVGTAQAGDTLNLPFFDDFSTAKTARPETAYWMSGSGVYINNSLTTNHPSLNVATFDGVNVSGNPYNVSNPLSQNYTDTLTSKPINLGGKVARDSLYISFFWLGKGLGEMPDSIDYIQLEFYGKNKEWVSVWKQNGYKIDTLFRQQLISIKDDNFFHNGFQFRFRGYGRDSGPYDTWHIDYVYLNSGRSNSNKFITDITVRKSLTPFFKNYTAMPLRQYRVNPDAATALSVTTDIVNLNNVQNFNTFIFTVKNAAVPNSNYLTINEGSTRIGPSTGNGSFVNQVKTYNVKSISLPASLSAVTLKYQMKVITTDNLNPDLKIDLTRNDTINAYADLTDYYSYDDGSAEYGVQINQKLARVAVRYILSRPDTIGGVRLNLVPFNKNISGQSFSVQLYSNKAGKPDQILAQRAIAAKYPDQRNGFLEYAFASPVAVADTFYVGWLQVNDEPVTFGFDRNSLLGKDKIFYNLNNSWSAEAGLKGSVMIHPYLGNTGQNVITGNEPLASTENYFFPNPSQGTIQWKNASLNKIEIYSVTGQMLQTILPVKGQQSAGLEVPKNGIYVIKASDAKRSFVQKVLIVK